ncbi:hypothetical protein HMPREF1143_0216 [Peptoanaerobacter stomatis]|uniref:Uncharacterized protein n=1 Tax=Peptoanaerobacter stomatis TaxID=796937 RepID=J5UCX5_9FIRM|nr:hypothetical protein [Peptoanaerobacter stomatis]EJU21579.1 hypothetical protein HMPREF1143_0216 [Peptoanaerobacter stomatis]NWO24663.1 hypothetical protein [Peptostreptococcaceae bacterium oral taxon 081]
MKNLIDDVKRHTSKIIPGYEYIKTQKVYIPFKKITIECQIRKVSELNLFFESILRLIEISVKKIVEISEILGVSDDIIKEAVVDMVNINYVFVSEGIITITEKGKLALKTKQTIDIKKYYLQDLIVDMVTGSIYDLDSIRLSKPQRRSVVLEEVINVDNEYLDMNFKKINNAYQLQQKNNSVFENDAIINEIYKIIGISYSELCYFENSIYIYKSESSNELLFDLSNDSNDKYKNEFYNQLKDSYRPCQEYFFEKNRTLINKTTKRNTEKELNRLLQTKALKELLFSDEVNDEKMFSSFTQDRYSLNDSEYLSYFYYPKAFQYNEIYICSDNLGRLISNELCYQIKIISNNTPIYIIYNKNEYKIKDSIGYFFNEHKENLHFIPKDTVGENSICFYPDVIMDLQEQIVTAFDKPISYLQISCTFNKEFITNKISEIIRKYNLSEFKENRKKENKKSLKKAN